MPSGRTTRGTFETVDRLFRAVRKPPPSGPAWYWQERPDGVLQAGYHRFACGWVPSAGCRAINVDANTAGLTLEAASPCTGTVFQSALGLL